MASSEKLKRKRTTPQKYREKEEEEEEASDDGPGLKKGRKSWIQRYDKEIVQMNHMRLMPKQIAETLQRKYSLDPKICSGRVVNARLAYIKKNKLYDLAPTNAAINLKAKDVPRNCKFLFFQYPINFFS